MTETSVSGLSGGDEVRRITADGSIGIIAGSGPDAGIDLWRKLLYQHRIRMAGRYRGDIDAPAVEIVSDPALGLSMDMDRHAEVVWPRLKAAVERLPGNCRSFTIACNTLHYFSARVQQLTTARFVSVENAVRSLLRSRNESGFALLGASPVMSLGKWSPYRPLTKEFEIETADPVAVDRIIYKLKAEGGGSAETTRELAGIMANLKSRVVILGCTELPLIRLAQSQHEVIDVTHFLACGLLGSEDID